MNVEIAFTPEFKRNLRSLAKKYPRIRTDLQPILDQLQAGDFMGEQIPGTGYTLYKVRVKNSDSAKGKRSGYRVIYYLKTPREIILVTMYSKTEQQDVSASQIQRILSEFTKTL